MRADLSLQQTPPFSVPARFLVSAPLFSLLAALVMLWYGPEMISHRWTPELLAVTHFLTLGFLAMSMLGSLMQLTPVLMGMVIPRATLFSGIVHTPLFLGSACLGLAWLLQINQLFSIAMALLGFAFLIFIMIISERLWRSENRHVTRSMMLLAVLALVITASLGLYLAMGYAFPAFPLVRQWTDLHLSWGLLGWVAMLIMAVAYQVIPMFQITDDYPAMHQRWLGWAIFACMLTLSLAYALPVETLKTVSSILLAACLMIFALTTLWVLQTRRRQIPDLTMMFWQLAMVSLVLLVLIWAISSLMNFDLPVLLGALFIHGFAMTTITGMMYKILPFIIWLHLSTRNKTLRDEGKRESQVKVPHMRKIIPEIAGVRQYYLHLISLILLLFASLLPQWFFHLAALSFLLAQTVLFFNLAKAAHFYNSKIIELETEHLIP
ncbi:MAG: hypothetical protein OQK32_03620 [Gammaproteobacteria bacterium]|nr:hypothetical protein [Gammaproteobacteria bacterium]MCW8923010.1 hypothetical protein [Gammaproteobacteria bacterium]